MRINASITWSVGREGGAGGQWQAEHDKERETGATFSSR